MQTTVVTVPDSAVDSDLASLLTEPAARLLSGALVAFPTETVYGLGANALDAQAVRRIFEVKRRPADNPLILHVHDVKQATCLTTDFTPLATLLGEAFWPGPLTVVLTAAPHVPSIATAGLDTVAIRVPDTPIAQALIRLAGVPVAAPSANLSGRPSPTTAAHVQTDFDGRIDWLIDGGSCAVGIESTVIDARGETPVVLREGGITREMLDDLLGAHRRTSSPVRDGGQTGANRIGPVASPGVRHAHYQPQAEVRIASPADAVALANRLADRRSVGLVAPETTGLRDTVTLLGSPATPQDLASALYATLRSADDLGLDVVVMAAVADVGLGRAVMDRLRRAAGHNG